MKAFLLITASLFIVFAGMPNRRPQSSKNYKSTYQDSVLICDSKSAYAYHSKWCTGLKKCTHEVKKVTLSEAKRLGFEKPCGFCY